LLISILLIRNASGVLLFSGSRLNGKSNCKGRMCCRQLYKFLPIHRNHGKFYIKQIASFPFIYICLFRIPSNNYMVHVLIYWVLIFRMNLFWRFSEWQILFINYPRILISRTNMPPTLLASRSIIRDSHSFICIWQFILCWTSGSIWLVRVSIYVEDLYISCSFRHSI
jgi:hypothetical protein